ncbi:hypothetical protein H0H92_008153 [Tricholoma furcatifolium]|nr:hypothetical protein H0H92_008153 [Tricholoma furcatifolium]
MTDEKSTHNDDAGFKTISPEIVTQNFGIWKIMTLKRSSFLHGPVTWMDWDKYTSALPHVRRLLWDVYSLNPPLILLYLVSRLWQGIEPGISMYASSQFYIELEKYLRDGKGDSSVVVWAIGIHLLCVMLSCLSSVARNHFVPRITAQANLFFEDQLMKAVIYKLKTLEQLHYDYETFMRLTKSQWSQGRLVTHLIAGIYELTLHPSPAMIIVAENTDYLRLKALETIGYMYREEINTQNLADYIVGEYKKSRERLGKLITGTLDDEFEIENTVVYRLVRSLSTEIPMLHFTFCALRNPSSYTLSTLAILRQQSQALTSGSEVTFRTFSGILRTLEDVNDLYRIEPLRVVDGNVDYRPSPDKRGMSLELRNVSFSYPYSPAMENALKDVSIKIHPGQLVVVVGQNGSGKSTLIKLLTRTYDVTSGEIIVDGVPIKDYRISSLRGATTLLNQDLRVYPLSLAENVGLGDPTHVADHKRIDEALKKGGASEIVAGLKDGLATNLEPIRTATSRNIKLPRDQALQDVLETLDFPAKVSGTYGRFTIKFMFFTKSAGGQLQRIVASRTFMRLQNNNIKFIAVDEPSSALDARGELQLFNNLRAEQNGRTTIFVTHRFGHLTKYADLIMYKPLNSAEILHTHW